MCVCVCVSIQVVCCEMCVYNVFSSWFLAIHKLSSSFSTLTHKHAKITACGELPRWCAPYNHNIEVSRAGYSKMTLKTT